ncbi:MAG: hypothetical protein A2431_00755 [Candidatus Zambryskibacteria bacterium RIFOXYC1_FULL_39_10]|uniref:Uncharacterized protein n=1 Tax=Candidatus Zambryskibacteria bacterium RIFOXYC1_FULL_39_10 TaxID=1802779 RepID=A0A1G2V2E1_9BACT|nr:MAG: hypothetical protein A2431_00755 [Candidatus Zambryskibacteria bacterium RIFOXYC1_FULL_39_10]
MFPSYWDITLVLTKKAGGCIIKEEGAVMAVYKNIFLRPDFQQTATHVWANIHLLQGYTAETVTAYIEMAEKLKEALPGLDIQDSEIRCGKVLKSGYCQNFSMVAWSGLITKDNEFDKLGWNVSDKPPSYYTT